jgi:hypothetical protein
MIVPSAASAKGGNQRGGQQHYVQFHDLLDLGRLSPPWAAGSLVVSISS